MMFQIGDDDLNAYVDGALEPGRALAVGTYLAAHPSDAARGEAYRVQGQWLHAQFDDALAEPVPRRLGAVLRRHGARLAWRRLAWAAAALLLALAALGLGGRALRAHFSLFHAVATVPPAAAPAARPPPGRFLRI